MKKSLFLLVAISITIILFIIAIGLLTWFFYINSFNDQVNVVPQNEEIDQFEGLSKQESDRVALDLLAPNAEEKTDQEKERDLMILTQLQVQNNQNSTTTSDTNEPGTLDSSFFNLQGQYQTPQESINNLEALMQQSQE